MYKRRILIFFSLIGLGLLVLVGRLGQLQILRGERFRQDYERSVRVVQLLPAARGTITDRLGAILAVDQPCKDLCFEYRFMVNDPKWVAKRIKAIQRQEGLSKAEAAEAYQQRASQTWALADEAARASQTDLSAAVTKITDAVDRIRRRTKRLLPSESISEEEQAHPVVRWLDDDSAAAADSRIQAGQTVGASVRPSHKRYYPYGDAACHIIGLTGPITRDDLERLNEPNGADSIDSRRDNYDSQDSIGISGVEKMCESALRGRRGYRVLDRSGELPQEIEGELAEVGQDIHLTIDINLQKFLVEQLRASGRNGAAVVLSVESGEVLAMASTPTFDLNTYRSDFARLIGDTLDLPLRNRAVTQLYPPGSTVKPIVAAAALAAGKITPQTTFNCSGHLHADDPTHWRCTGTHGEVDLELGVQHSCNVYFYELGGRLGALLMGEWFRHFGLDDVPGTGLPEEKRGRFPDQAWLQKNVARSIWVSEAQLMGIGQGRLLVTPLHVANSMATIARNGRLMSPLLAVGAAPSRPPQDLPISQAFLDAVRHGMYSVVNRPGGTAYTVFREGLPLGVEVCGKTGTADSEPQRVDVDGDGKIEMGEVVRQGNMGWFAGFAPYRKPKIAFAVVVEYIDVGVHGATTAGPIARELVRECKRQGYLGD